MTDARASLFLDGGSVVHRLPASPKVLAHVAFVLVVVATPPSWWWTFAGYGALLVAVAVVARVPAPVIVRRMVVEVPFVVFALLLPLVSGGPRRDVAGLSLSEAGLLSGWNILVKGTLGVVASILLASTTDTRALLAGLRGIGLPRTLVDIASFMVRYLGVVHGEMHRMRVARESRAFTGRRLDHAVVVAQGAGALFVRTYERGERVHLAMLARGGGIGGSGSGSGPGSVGAHAWHADAPAVGAALLPAAALLVLGAGWIAS